MSCQYYMDLRVLYEDNHLIAVYKPAGVLVQADKTGDPSLIDEVKYFLKTKYHKLGKVFVGVLHRLDRPVSGIVLFAKTSKGAARLSEQFREYTIEKIYEAKVIGKPKANKGTLRHFLKKDKDINVVKVFERETEDAQDAELDYEVLKSDDKYSLLKIKLKTGRSHQIRAQFSHVGHPIVGDVKYGAPEPLPDKSIALAAVHLSFTTATGDKKIDLNIEPPFKI